MISQNDRKYPILLQFIEQCGLSKVDPRDLTLNPLKGGNSKASLFSFNLNSQPYVLRLLPAQADWQTRLHQILLATQAGEIGVGPKVFFVDPQREGMVIEFIPGRTVQPRDFQQLEALVQFAALLKQLHQSPIKFPVACSPFRRFQNFLASGKQKNVIYPDRLLEVLPLMDEIEKALESKPSLQVPTHLDLHPLNIMRSKDRFVLVDWVNGGLCDPYFDLTTFSTFHDLNEAQLQTFFSHYLERAPTEYEWSRYTVIQPVRLFVIAAALLSTEKISKAVYEEAYSSTRLPTLADCMRQEPNQPLWQLGLGMLKAGFALIEQDTYKRHLYNKL